MPQPDFIALLTKTGKLTLKERNWLTTWFVTNWDRTRIEGGEILGRAFDGTWVRLGNDTSTWLSGKEDEERTLYNYLVTHPEPRDW